MTWNQKNISVEITEIVKGLLESIRSQKEARKIASILA